MADSKEILICPACGKEMEKVFIEGANCNLDICTNGCGGIFFDKYEYKKFDEVHESIDEIKKALEGKTFKHEDVTFKRKCPACGSKMVKNSASIKSQIVVDDCYNCGGKFLDCDELFKIRDEYATEEERTQAVSEFLKQKMGAEYNEMHAHQIVIQKQISDYEKKNGFLDRLFKKFF